MSGRLKVIVGPDIRSEKELCGLAKEQLSNEKHDLQRPLLSKLKNCGKVLPVEEFVTMTVRKGKISS